MIKCHLSRLMGEKKLKIADLAREVGVHRNTITLLYYERAKRIDFDVLDRLCQYFKCNVGDILEYKEKN
ncbi:MAG TPA: helix-turn-helix transcriptional regulator [Thermodesulfovibrio thiophilus]|nr:helix-turn-helix transcriptional regulator [Thermodesulfovibrio thiophilus]